MPRLTVPNPVNSEQFTQVNPAGVAATVASGANIGDTERTQAASTLASGASGIAEVQAKAAADVAKRSTNYFNEAQASIEDSIYNDAYAKASREFNQAYLNRMNQPTDEKGTPTFGTLPADVDKLGSDIASKYSATINNPAVQQRFNANFGQLQSTRQTSAMQESRTQQQQFAVGALTQNLLQSTQSGIVDQANKDMYYTQGADSVDSALRAGYISPVDAVKQKENLRNKIYAGGMSALNMTDPRLTQQILNNSKPEDLKLTDLEYLQLKQKNAIALNELDKKEKSVRKERESLDLQKYNFNAQEIAVGVQRGDQNPSTIQESYDKGLINHKQWSELTKTALAAQGITATKSATRTRISGDLSDGRPLVGYTSADINDHYNNAVGITSQKDKPATILDKAKVASQYNAPVSAFTDEVSSVVKGSKDPNAVLQAAQALDYAASVSPAIMQGIDKETLGLVTVIAGQTKSTNQDPARIIDRARQQVLNLDPTVKEFRDKQFSSEKAFKSTDIVATVNGIVQKNSSGIFSAKVQPDLIPMYNSLLKQAYDVTGNQDDAITMVQAWTKDTVGTSAVNSIERLGPDKQQSMLYPPEKLLPQYSADQIRRNLNSSVDGVLMGNTHNPEGLTSDQVFIQSDATTRQDLKNPSYLLYFLDKGGNKQVVLDKDGIPVHYKINDAAKAEMNQEKEKELQAIHQRALEGNEVQKSYRNNELYRIFNQSKNVNSTLELAKKYVGLDEVKDQRILSTTMSKMLGVAVDPSRTPWCAAFVNTMLQANGFKGSGSLRADSFLQWGKPTDVPADGDVVVTQPLAAGATGHVGLFAGYEYKDNERYVKILAGNAHNAVAYQSIPEKLVRGFRQPPTVSELQSDDQMREIMKYQSKQVVTDNTDPNAPRGLRNNNPGNLRLTNESWNGEVKGSDNAFKTFKTPEDGIRGIELSLNKKAARGLNTVQDIISAYAPSSENDTKSYVNQVASALGVSPKDKINLKDKTTMTKLISAIINQENGQNPFSDEQISTALG